MANRDYRGFTDGGLVHYVWQDVFLDFTTECWTAGVRYENYTVEESQAPVNCMLCLVCVDVR
jgi:hypothetical protein